MIVRRPIRDDRLRRTGIDAIGEIPWGTHFCQFYESKQDLLDLLVPYFKAGLESDEYCLWVVSDPLSEEEALDALRAAVPDIERHQAAGSIEILSHHDWYLRGGSFDPVRVIEGWKEKLNDALARGYAGMRVQGNESWLTDRDWRDFLAYERRLNAVLLDLRMIVVCTYPLLTRNAGEIFDVARSHEFAIARRHRCWDVLETPEVRQAKAELLAQKAELEQRVRESAQQIAAVTAEAEAEMAERRRAEQRMRRSDQRLRLVIENVPAAVYTCNRDGLIEYFNARAVELWGRIPALQDARERYCGSLRIHATDGKPIPLDACYMARVLQSGVAERNREVVIERPDGSRVTVLANIAPQRDERGELVGAVSCLLEITDRKRAEEALREAQAELARVARIHCVGELAASIAHELNQPLGAMVTNADAALRWLGNETPNLDEARQAMRRIARDGHRASNIIAQARALLRKGESQRTRISLPELIGDTLELLQDEVRRRGATCQVQLAPELPEISGDRVQIQQVLLNLLMNALDALDAVAGRPRRIEVHAESESSQAVRVSVSDTGVGIDPTQLDRVFDAFFTTKRHGLGLGLSISQSIVEAHGGQLWAESAAGCGATFIFLLSTDGKHAP